MSNGALREEEFWGEFTGIELASSIAELRRRLWFDETHDVQVDAIRLFRWRFFVGFVNTFTDVDVSIAEFDFILLVICWESRDETVEEWWKSEFDVDFIWRKKPVGEVESTDGTWFEYFFSTQHRNEKVRVVSVPVDEEE